MRIVLILAVLMTAPIAAEASAPRAKQMCRWLDSLEFTTGSCAVSGKAVDIKVEAPKSEASAICKSITSTLRGDGVKFDAGWKLRIFNPLTGNSKSTECKI